MKRTFNMIMLMIALSLGSCRKDFLGVKPDQALLIPETPADLRALLDNSNVFNKTPALTGIADGDLITTDAGWKAYSSDQERNSYSWAPDIFGLTTAPDWNVPFQQIFYANVVLDRLDELLAESTDQVIKNELKGTALFYRAFACYQLTQQFCPPYSAATLQLPGLPLHLHADISAQVGRATLSATYDQLLLDLEKARQLLPATTAYLTRPTTAAALALLARVYLAQQDYTRAGSYADTCLQLRSALIDYNTLSSSATRPFPKALPNNNPEILFFSLENAYSYTSSVSPTTADPALYASYAANDLRKTFFFKASGNSGTFKGNYAGVIATFAGIATDELYLIRAEASARAGRTDAALTDLNNLLIKRWRTGTFSPLTASTADEALRLVLTERRKELIGRNLRWTDLRRLNGDPRFAVTLSRTINGQTYLLPPGDLRYTYPIPADEQALSGLTNNFK